MTHSIRIGQFRQSRLFGPIRITTVERRADERIVHCRSADGKTVLILSPDYCKRLPVLDHA